ncbi:ethanolaminephosphotransferase [Nematocida homosporus]|uniref:ethanolaminephosphotransferase n=1 Tax=Nematocida homosporus TaxID=1912981 RepID=UPI002220E23C|nr:ethanolaminephosphotransferase [Nematocida homosporus]KAI5185264.1 ethanolaminephosphotransferase [Nematocida homosporus]
MFTKRNTSYLQSYQYKSQDGSFLTNYCPYWNYLKEYIPASVSPNAITLLGFLVMAVHSVVVAVADPGYEGRVRILPAISGVALFFYSTMDALDGVQARQRGTGSAYGQLFDHGVDSIVCTLVVNCVCSGVGLRSKKAVLLSLVACQTIFYWTSAQEYYKKVFVLGLIGPTEVILGCCVLLVLLSIFGQPTVIFFQRSHPHLLARIAVIGSLLVAGLGTAYYVTDIYWGTGFWLKREPDALGMAKRLLPHVLFVGMHLAMIYSALNLRKVTAKGFWSFLGTCTLAFSLFTIMTIYSHQLQAPYIESPLILPALVGLSTLAICIAPTKVVNSTLLVLFIFALLNYIYHTRAITKESLDELNIPFFNNVPRKKGV